MPLDASIFGNVGRFKSVADYDAEAEALAQQRQARKVSDLRLAQIGQQMADADSQRARQTRLSELLRTPADQRIQALDSAGFMDEAARLRTQGLQEQRQQMQLDAERANMLAGEAKQQAQVYRSLLANPRGVTQDDVVRAVGDMRGRGMFRALSQQMGISEDDAALKLIRDLPPEPAALAGRLREMSDAALGVEKQLGQYQYLNTGNAFVRANPNAPGAPESIPINMTPAQAAKMGGRGSGGGGGGGMGGGGMARPSERQALSAELGVPVAARDPWSGQRNPDVAMRQAQTQATDEIKEISEAARSARNMADSAARFMSAQANVSQRFQQGPLAGRAPAVTAEAQLMDTETALITPQMRQPGSGATSDFDAQMFMRSTLNRTNKPEVNQTIAEGIKAHSELTQQRLRFMQDYLTVNGHLNDAGRYWERYLNANPIFDRRSETPRLNQNRVTYQQFFSGTPQAQPQAPANDLAAAARAEMERRKAGR